mmetsp:Transcript_9193/g.22580  ORF Transcript_9193/g.22580 Transcript_9193/m.22580 type:complete len:239 (-) Transcript_9193:87-803(-)|eukprot:CAMPEP_0114500302 /NCGR_PEP_ID=MMETSP0109-20121206/7890_1 /TAXON_ID=29199 /ORGANISM="Chlorarachnion reptans, Strain CCCM449" /LENGTH=238 /DNA_ID=CAMNT_0001677951 /DNA_START=234 /DNA_END=950 /DNA_ORIENTATION=-
MSTILIGIVLIAILIVSAFFLLQKESLASTFASGTGNAIMLIGPMGSGKTTLWYRLLLGKDAQRPKTVTSQVLNEEKSFKPNKDGKAVHLIDHPGHDSQWPSALENAGSNALGIIFMVDATSNDYSTAGQKLFDLMCDPSIKRRKVPFLIACNKSDDVKASGAQDIEDKIIEDLRDRMEMKDTIEDTEGNVIQKTLLEGMNTDDMFEFEHSPCPVQIASVSVENDDIQPIIKFCSQFT